MTIRVWSWRQAVSKSSLPAYSKLLLLSLANYMNEHGNGCYPTIDTLMADTSLTKPTVIKYLQEAVEAGFLVTRKHGFSGQGWARNEYVARYPSQYELVREHTEGSKPDLLPSSHLEGGKQDLPPMPKAVNAVGEGGKRHDEKAVNRVYSNSPLELSIEHNPPNPPGGEQPEPMIFEIIVEIWNDVIGVAGGCRATLHTKNRRIKVINRMKDSFGNDPSRFRAYCSALAAMPFYMGENARNWQATLDWALEPRNITKIMEAHDQKHRNTTSVAALPPMETQPLLQPVIDDLTQRIGEPSVRSWFNGLQLVGIEGDKIRLTVERRFQREHILSRFQDALREACRKQWPDVQAMVLSVRDDQNGGRPQPPDY